MGKWKSAIREKLCEKDIFRSQNFKLPREHLLIRITLKFLQCDSGSMRKDGFT